MTQPNMLDIAHEALRRQGGIVRLFDNANYANAEVCKKALVKYRNSFYAFKAKARREQLSRFNDAETMYDDLGCSIEQTPTGWSATICKTVYNKEEFVDAEGRPIKWLAEGVAS